MSDTNCEHGLPEGCCQVCSTTRKRESLIGLGVIPEPAVSSLTTHEADDAIGWECRECKKFNLSHRAQCRNCKTASPLM